MPDEYGPGYPPGWSSRFGVQSALPEMGEARDMRDDLWRGYRNYEPTGLMDRLRNYIDTRARIEQLERFIQRGSVPVMPGPGLPASMSGVRG